MSDDNSSSNDDSKTNSESAPLSHWCPKGENLRKISKGNFPIFYQWIFCVSSISVPTTASLKVTPKCFQPDLPRPGGLAVRDLAGGAARAPHPKGLAPQDAGRVGPPCGTRAQEALEAGHHGPVLALRARVVPPGRAARVARPASSNCCS